ncbi:MAG: hypothetical protein HY472_01600 [Candidatus Sungbacteria bacterium]|nr:hypothetical protein [Candidatus Sungbacteria bacterium]
MEQKIRSQIIRKLARELLKLGEPPDFSEEELAHIVNDILEEMKKLYAKPSQKKVEEDETKRSLRALAEMIKNPPQEVVDLMRKIIEEQRRREQGPDIPWFEPRYRAVL